MFKSNFFNPHREVHVPPTVQMKKLEGISPRTLFEHTEKLLDQSNTRLRVIEEEINRLQFERSNTQLAIESLIASYDVLKHGMIEPLDMERELLEASDLTEVKLTEDQE